MGKFLAANSAALLPLQTPEYYNFTGRLRGNITESNRLIKMPVAGSFYNWAVYADAVGSGRTANFRKDTGGGPANGNLSPTITNTTAGAYRDSTHIDTVNVGDKVDFVLAQTASTTTWYWSAMTFEAAFGHVGLYHYTGTGLLSFNATKYLPIDGDNSGSATESDSEMVMRVPGIRSIMQVATNANNLDVVTTVVSRVNGADGNMTFTLPSNAGTGFFEYTGGGSDSFVSGDRLCTKTSNAGTTGSNSLNYLFSIITANAGSASDMFCYANIARAASATKHFFPPFGAFVSTTVTSETEKRMTPGFPCVIRNFRVRCTANTYSVDAQVVLRKNGVDQITLTLTAGSTALIEDAVSQVYVGATDDLSISVVGGSSGSATLAYFAMTLDSAPVDPFGLNLNQSVRRAAFV